MLCSVSLLQLQIEDELLTGFHVEWDGSLGFLRIAGEATASDYLRVLRSIQYVNPTGTPGNRKCVVRSVTIFGSSLQTLYQFEGT